METLTRPLQEELETQEPLQHFDVLSSVDLMRFDLQALGYIRPETQQRVYDEEFSYVAEGLNRPMYTEFTLQERDGKLVYFHHGQWTPYVATLEKGLRAAHQARGKDFRKQILVDMAEKDLQMYYQFSALKPGERLVWHSEFNDEYHQRYGTEFMQKLGFQPGRRMGFLYEVEKHQGGSLTFRTQSVDNSNPEGFEAATTAAATGSNFTDSLNAYDAALESQTGKKHYAGRLIEGYSEEEAWLFITQNKDLTAHYMAELEKLARSTGMVGQELERSKKRLTYGMWATLKERLDSKHRIGASRHTGNEAVHQQALHQEIQAAYSKLVHKGEQLFGCGGSIKGEDALLGANAEDVFDAVFGNKSSEEDQFGPLKFKCPNGHWNKRQREAPGTKKPKYFLDKCKCGAPLKC